MSAGAHSAGNILRIFFLILLFASALCLAAQDGSNEDSRTLFERTIAIDIDTSSYHELVAWARQLGLDTTGSRRELQQRLLNHYNQEERLKTVRESQNLFIIESANRSEYFTVEKSDEDYIKISGNVFIRIENDDGTSHSIRTDRVIFNRSNDLMTAEGNVTYIRRTGRGEEVFSGRKLSFNISNWEGIFIEARSEQTITEDDGTEITFVYSGDRIFKSNDVIIIDNARITSRNYENPYYSIRARRVWVLAPNEWGLRNAVLYVGHVPMFFFPFFFHPGDTLVFNPAFGIRQPVGYFMQTTTYLFGSPRPDRESSFFSMGADSAEYETELRGIFLRKVRRREDGRTDDQYIKVMFDIYSRLGLFAGIEGRTNLIDFYLGVARSRNIYITPFGYSVFFEDQEGRFRSAWNDAHFLSYTVPFRFGIELEMRNSFRNFRYNLSLDFYSDPFFLRDFNERAELTDWGQLLGLEDERVATHFNTGAMDRLWWYFHSSYRRSQRMFGGAITEINVTKFDFSMNWRNKRQDGIGADIPHSARTDYFFPEQHFYFPEFYKFPDVSLTVRGDIFSRSTGRTTARTASARNGRERHSSTLISPWEIEREEFERDNENESVSRIIGSERKQDVSVKAFREREIFYHSMRYSISPNFSVTETMDHTRWDRPSDIDFGQAYTETRTHGRADIFYSLRLYDDIFSFDNNIVITGDYRTRSNRSDTVGDAQWNRLVEQDYRATFFKVENRSTFRIFPLFRYEMYDQSFLRYQVDIVSFKREFDHLDANRNPHFSNNFFIHHDRNHFTRHEAEAHLKYFSWWNQMQQFRVRYVLPPLLQRVENENIFRTGPLTTTTLFQWNEKETGGWVPGNYILRNRLSFDNRTFIEHILIYDGYNDEWDTSQTIGRLSFLYDEIFFLTDFRYGFKVNSPLEFTATLNLWFFQAQYRARRQLPMYYDLFHNVWMVESEERFVPSEFLARIDFSRYFMPKWRNRVRYRTNLVTTWRMDLQEYTNNALVVDFGFDFQIHRFLKIHFNTRSENNRTYRYIPFFARGLGEEWLNPVTDLLKSFNFFNTQHRHESSFKLKQLDFKIVHHLGDWDLSLQYTGMPDFFEPPGASPRWVWSSEATVLLQWNPIRPIRTEIRRTSDERFRM